MKKLFIYATILCVILLSSCATEFEKLLKNNDYALRYREAYRYYDKKKYEQSAALFESVVAFYRNTPQDDSVQYYIAECFYANKDYVSAEHYYTTFSQNFTRSIFTQVADFRSGKCSYNMVPRSDLDQTYAYKAIDAFNLYIYKYPSNEKIQECRDYLLELSIHLAKKINNSAHLYYKTGDYRAAFITFRNCLKEFPDSQYREEQLYYSLLSSYKLADMSIEDKKRERYQATIDEYLNLISEYPTTKYIKDSKRIFDKASAVLKNTETVE